MQSSLWSNPSSIFTQQQQQQPQQSQLPHEHQQQQQQQPPHHHYQHHQDSSLQAPHEDVCPHLKVMRRPLGGDHSRQQQPLLPQPARVHTPPPIPPPPPPLFSSPAARLASSGSFRATNIDEEADAGGTISEATPAVTSASAASFPLLRVDTCVRQSVSTTAAHPLLLVPLVTRQQGYLQQQQQKLFPQNQQQQLQPQSQIRQHCLSTASTTEEDLRQMLHRKRIRYRALIVAYLTFMLLFVLAVVFLSAFGVFHTAGSEAGAQSGPPVTSIPPERPAAGIRQGAPSRVI